MANPLRVGYKRGKRRRERERERNTRKGKREKTVKEKEARHPAQGSTGNNEKGGGGVRSKLGHKLLHLGC